MSSNLTTIMHRAQSYPSSSKRNFELYLWEEKHLISFPTEFFYLQQYSHQRQNRKKMCGNHQLLLPLWFYSFRLEESLPLSL